MFNKSWKLSFSFNKVFHIETTHYRSSKKNLFLKYYAIDLRISQKRRSQHRNRLIIILMPGSISILKLEHYVRHKSIFRFIVTATKRSIA